MFILIFKIYTFIGMQIFKICTKIFYIYGRSRHIGSAVLLFVKDGHPTPLFVEIRDCRLAGKHQPTRAEKELGCGYN